MPTPRIEIDLGKIAHNARTLKSLYGAKGIGVIGVTKGVCGDPSVAKTLVDSGIDTLADSRTANIQKMRDAGVAAQFLLLRTPLLSQAEAVLSLADISLNSEISVVEKLAELAEAQNTTHKVILMVELGDLREGLMPRDMERAVQRVVDLEGIELAGIGTNLACFGGVKPDVKNMATLSSLADEIEERFGLTLTFVSGGNSANFSWFTSTRDVGRINNLRLGESILLGREALQREPIPGLYTDAFTLIAEVIEAKTKPSQPYGEICQDAFGNVPEFQDRGQTNRALVGIGRQDVSVSGLTPSLDVDILGSSSDHVVLDARQSGLEVGDEVAFDLNYAALLASMTSPYVFKEYIQ
jgi:ornithine racemase